MSSNIHIPALQAAAARPVRLLNIYKGVPIAYEAEILRIEEATAWVSTQPYQIVCLYHERRTFIQSPSLPEILDAEVVELDPPNLQAALGYFHSVPSGIGDRHQLRVQPEETLMGEVFTRGMGATFRAELADLSLDGVGVYIPRSNFYPTVYRIGVKVRITVNLPGGQAARSWYTGDLSRKDPMDRFSRDALRTSHAPGHTRPLRPDEAYAHYGGTQAHVEINTEIANLREELGQDRYRVGLRILPGDPSRSAIQGFISQRQAQIIREMQDVYRLLQQDEQS